MINEYGAVDGMIIGKETEVHRETYIISTKNTTRPGMELGPPWRKAAN
jgi:hypothetical protein